MPRHHHDSHLQVGPLFGAGLALLLACDGDAGPAGLRYTPDAGLERLQHLALPAPDAEPVRDFDVAGDTLFLLAASPRVLVLVRQPEAWQLVGEFGREGYGPGELSSAVGVTLTSDGLLVSHAARLQFFDRAGRLLGDRELRPPCGMLRPRAAAGSGGIYIHGLCQAPGYVTDTVKAVLAWSADTAEYEVIAQDVAFTRDGSVGSIFGATSALTTGADGVHVFGGGTSNCVWRISDGRDAPRADAVCPAVRDLYSADPPPGLEARLRAGIGGASMTWPRTLPAFVERLRVGDEVLLVRPTRADTVVLQLAGAEPLDIAVAPLNGFIGCKRDGCLWLLDDRLRPHAILLTRDDAARLLARRRKP